jgi:hypothetical protein
MSATTILYGDRVTEVADARVEGDHLWLRPQDLNKATGWKLETEGLCKDAACVRTDQMWLDKEGRVDLGAFARYMGQPIVREDAAGAWAFGESVNARRDSMFSLDAPDFTLPDIDGKLHSLADFRGKKVLLFSWGSY